MIFRGGGGGPDHLSLSGFAHGKEISNCPLPCHGLSFLKVSEGLPAGAVGNMCFFFGDGEGGGGGGKCLFPTKLKELVIIIYFYLFIFFFFWGGGCPDHLSPSGSAHRLEISNCPLPRHGLSFVGAN